jgi:hypothetical protein
LLLLLLLLLFALQEVIQNLKPGDSLMFCQEPSNPADPGAVHVRTIHLEASVGYIPQHLTDAFQLPVSSLVAAAAAAAACGAPTVTPCHCCVSNLQLFHVAARPA